MRTWEKLAIVGVGGLVAYALIKNEFSYNRQYSSPSASDLYNTVNRAADNTALAVDNVAGVAADTSNIIAGAAALIDVPLSFLSMGASNTMDILHGDWSFLNLNSTPNYYGGGGGGGR